VAIVHKVYLAKFGDIQNMKVKKKSQALSHVVGYCDELVAKDSFSKIFFGKWRIFTEKHSVSSSSS